MWLAFFRFVDRFGAMLFWAIVSLWLALGNRWVRVALGSLAVSLFLFAWLTSCGVEPRSPDVELLVEASRVRCDGRDAR